MERDYISEKTFKMPAGVTMNIQLNQLTRRLHISYFRDVLCVTHYR